MIEIDTKRRWATLTIEIVSFTLAIKGVRFPRRKSGRERRSCDHGALFSFFDDAGEHASAESKADRLLTERRRTEETSRRQMETATVVAGRSNQADRSRTGVRGKAAGRVDEMGEILAHDLLVGANMFSAFFSRLLVFFCLRALQCGPFFCWERNSGFVVLLTHLFRHHRGLCCFMLLPGSCSVGMCTCTSDAYLPSSKPD